MTDDSLVEALVEEAVSDYRIDRPAAREIVEEVLRHDSKLLAAAAGQPDLRRLRRTRSFRDARKKVRKTVYYALRQYKRAAGSLSGLAQQLTAAGPEDVGPLVQEILASHSSTRERQEVGRPFGEELLKRIGRPRTLLDVGCGVYPLMFPFGDAPDLDRYLALDRDAEAIEALRAFAGVSPEKRLEARRWELASGFDESEFDVALLLKLVPVIARQEPEALSILARVPARRLVVSGSRVALARQADIERRERSVLRRWIDGHGFEVVDEMVFDDEFAFVLERQR